MTLLQAQIGQGQESCNQIQIHTFQSWQSKEIEVKISSQIIPSSIITKPVPAACLCQVRGEEGGSSERGWDVKEVLSGLGSQRSHKNNKSAGLGMCNLCSEKNNYNKEDIYNAI